MTRRDDIRGLMLAAVCTVMLLFALPTPPQLDAHRLSLPQSQAEIARWSPVLRSVGLSPDDVIEQIGPGIEVWSGAVTTLRRPFKPVLQLMGIGQSWALFAQGDEFPTRLSIAVVRNGSEEVVYQRLDSFLDWKADLLGYRRVRGVYDQVARSPSPAQRALASALAMEAWIAWPDAGAMVFRLRQNHVTLPGEPKDLNTSVRLQQTVTR